MSTLAMGPGVRFQTIDFFIPAAELIANQTQYFVAPDDGYWDSMDTVVNVANTSAGTITPKNNSQAVYATDQTQGGAIGYTMGIVGVAPGTPNTVAGLAQTIGAGATVGTIQLTNATPGDPSLLVKKGAQIQLVLAGFATAGEVRGTLRFRSEPLQTLAPLVM